MKARLPWIGALAVCLVIGWCGGGSYREGSIRRAQADSVSRLARAQGAAVIVQSNFVAQLSARTDSFGKASRVRQAGFKAERITEKAAADTLKQAMDLLATTLPQLFDTRDSLRVRTQQLRLAEQWGAHLEAALDRAVRHIAEVERERDSVDVNALRWKALAMHGRAAILAMQSAWDAEREAHACRIGPQLLHIGCPSRAVIAVASVAAGGIIGYRLAKLKK